MGYYHDITLSEDGEFEDKHLISDQYIKGFIKIEEKLVTMININNIIALKDSLGGKNEIPV
jgi:chemotaxis signal transduction protein